VIKAGSVHIKYDHVGGGLVVKGDKLAGFALAGSDKKWVWADARFTADERKICACFAHDS